MQEILNFVFEIDFEKLSHHNHIARQKVTPFNGRDFLKKSKRLHFFL